MMILSSTVAARVDLHVHARKLTFIALLLFAFALAPNARAQSRIGYVLDVKCDWFMNSRKLARATPVTAGAHIHFQNTNQTNCGIVILNNNGAVLVKRDCNRPGECDQPFNLPNNAPQPSAPARVANAVWRLLWGSPQERYESTVSRGKNLNEAILELKAGSVDLSPVFKDIEADTYNLRFTPVERPRKGKVSGPISVVFSWRPPQSPPLRVAGLSPGLFNLNLLDAIGDQLVPSDSEVWVLVSDPAHYRELSRAFAEAKSLTESWGDEVKPDAKHTFLRTYLASLARVK